MIKFTFGDTLLNGLRTLLTDEGVEKALESAIEFYNWYVEKEGKAPSGFYCSFAGDEPKDFKDGTSYYDAKFIYKVMPYSFTFAVDVEDLVFEESPKKVEFDTPYTIDEFFCKDLEGAKGASVIVMFKDECYSEYFHHPDIMIGQICCDSDGYYYVRIYGTGDYNYNIYKDEVHQGCKIMIPSRRTFFTDEE